MKGPNFAVHNFACPDCKLNCQLIQDGRRASLRHQNPVCKTYEATRPSKANQKFLELAFIAPTEENERLLVAFKEGTKELTEASPETIAAVDAARAELEQAAGVEEAKPTEPTLPSGPDEVLAENIRNWVANHPPTRKANPPRWQPLLEQLSSELRALVYERGEHSRGLAQAMADAEPGAVLQGFDDSKIAHLAQSIAALAAASKGHP